jgi:YD repeat-containing protein
MLTATDPAGIQTSYEYDALGRLIRIRDHAGHATKEYEYYYMSN